MLEDELLFKLLRGMTIEPANEIGRVREIYRTAGIAGEPSFDERCNEGWLRVIWGRVWLPSEISRTARDIDAAVNPAFAAFAKSRFDTIYLLDDTVRADDRLTAIVADLENAALSPRDIGSQSHDWVAARLWDRTYTGFSAPSVALRTWIDKWEVLGEPLLVPLRVWSEPAAKAFVQAVLDTLKSEANLVGWEELRAQVIKERAIATGQSQMDLAHYIPLVPDSLVERALWLEDHAVERSMYGIGERNDIAGTVRILLAEAEAIHDALPPHQIVLALLELATVRPELLFDILFKFRARPVLLADVALHAPASALACLLIAQWQPPSTAWDREIAVRENSRTKTVAFTDAVSVMGYYLKHGKVQPGEVASLLEWLHQTVQPGPPDTLASGESLLTILRDELRFQSPQTLNLMIEFLVTSKPRAGLGTASFAAALDLIDLGKLSTEIDPLTLVSAYVESLVEPNYTLSAGKVSAGEAAALCELGLQEQPELRQKFLTPLDIKGRLAAAKAHDENPYIVEDQLARSLRAHISVLCRAASAWTPQVPHDLADALISSIHAGARSDEDNGRISAFAARHEASPHGARRARPIAADLGAALKALTGEVCERALVAVLEIDEPMVLAQLLSFAPRECKIRIEKRIGELTPAQSGAIRSLTEAQARVETLLAAGMTDSAALYIDAEQGLTPFGKVPGRELVRFRALLQLQLLQGNWSGVAAAKPPPGLSEADQNAARESIVFYRALAALSDPAGDHDAAEQMLAQLHRSHGNVAAYIINLLAAQISILLKGNLFGQFAGTELLEGQQALAEAEQAMLRINAVISSEAEAFNRNKAVLLLALGKPEAAYEVLSTTPIEYQPDRHAAYTAIALARTGRLAEALATLHQAKLTIGETAILEAASAHIRNGKSFASLADILFVDDPIPRIREAYYHLKSMPPLQQAEVLHAPPEAEFYLKFVTDHVRAAAASVLDLVPVMRNVQLNEDDINTFVRELLASRLAFLGWAVPDQSIRGYSSQGNPGRPDLILQKDNITFAAIEAVVCRDQIPYQRLTSHFQKLLGYASCTLFFHLTYAYLDDVTLVLDHLKKISQTEAPAVFQYRQSTPIPLTDSRPKGFVASYGVRDDEIKVVFLVLDMEQKHQKNAAKLAGTKKSDQ